MQGWSPGLRVLASSAAFPGSNVSRAQWHLTGGSPLTVAGAADDWAPGFGSLSRHSHFVPGGFPTVGNLAPSCMKLGQSSVKLDSDTLTLTCGVVLAITTWQAYFAKAGRMVQAASRHLIERTHAMLTRVGEIEIWRILDWQGLFLTPSELFPNAPDDVAQIIESLAPGSVDAETGRLILPVQAYLLKTPDHVVLIDTGLGNDKTNKSLPFWHHLADARLPAELAKAGVAPQDVDYVLTTHLHTDHIGWNTRLVDGSWVPVFRNARYLIPAKDEEAMRGRGIASYDENITPIIEAGQAEMIDASFQLGDEISLMATPGHTPGHVSVMLKSGGEEAVITGDAIHSTAQCQNPTWQFRFDWDADIAVASRRALLETCVARGLTVIGFHFVLPSIGRVEADGDLFRWVAQAG